MNSPDEAAKCIQHLDRTELHGKMIVVERAKSDPAAHSKAAAVKKTDGKSAEVKKDDKKEADKKEADKKDVKKDDKKEVKKDDAKAGVKKDAEKKDVKKEVKKEEKKEDKGTKEEDKSKPGDKGKEVEVKSKDGKDGDKKQSPRSTSRTSSQPKKTGDRKDVLSFDKIKEARERERLRQRERRLREEESRRLRNLDIARQRQREVEWQQKNEAMRLEREKERIRMERERLEREKADAERQARIRLEAERRERERIERERIEEQRRLDQIKLEQEQHRRAMKRPYDSQNNRDNDPYWNDNKRQITSDRYDSRGNHSSQDRHDRYDRNQDNGHERRVEKYDRRDNRSANTRDSGNTRYDNNRRDRDSRDSRDTRGHADRDVRVSRDSGKSRDQGSRVTAQNRDVGRRDITQRGDTRTVSRDDRSDLNRFDNRGGVRDDSRTRRDDTGVVRGRNQDTVMTHDRRNVQDRAREPVRDTRTDWKNDRSAVIAQVDRRDTRQPVADTRYVDSRQSNSAHGTHGGGREAWHPHSTQLTDDRSRNKAYTAQPVMGSITTGRDQWTGDHGKMDNWGGVVNTVDNTMSRQTDHRWQGQGISNQTDTRGAFAMNTAGLLPNPGTTLYIQNPAAAQVTSLLMGQSGGVGRQQDARFDAYKSMGNTIRRY